MVQVRDDQQRVAVCRVLCPKPHLFDESGPTDRATKLLEAGLTHQHRDQCCVVLGIPHSGFEASGMSGGESVMFRLAFEVWSMGASKISFDEIFRLDRRNTEMIGSLIRASTDPNALDTWLDEYGG